LFASGIAEIKMKPNLSSYIIMNRTIIHNRMKSPCMGYHGYTEIITTMNHVIHNTDTTLCGM